MALWMLLHCLRKLHVLERACGSQRLFSATFPALLLLEIELGAAQFGLIIWPVSPNNPLVFTSPVLRLLLHLAFLYVWWEFKIKLLGLHDRLALYWLNHLPRLQNPIGFWSSNSIVTTAVQLLLWYSLFTNTGNKINVYIREIDSV